MRRKAQIALVALVALILSGCAGEAIWDSDEAVAQAVYRAPGPTTVTLITSINTRNNSGAHSALLIDGTQRLLFDPAGNWHNPGVPERNDVLFGMSPGYMDLYLAFQSNGVFEAHLQTVEVSPEIAAQLSAAVQAYGPVAPAFCSRSVTEILSGTQGFETVTQGFFPKRTMDQFALIPGVRHQLIAGTVSDEEAGSNRVLEEQLATVGAGG